ncbi:MAG: lipoyl(octanoyl) transferase LipB [Cyanobacteria bacterium P01_F01_bin.33]
MKPELHYCLPGEVPYQTARIWQQSRVSLAATAETNLTDSFLLLTHPPVYTLGQGGDARYLKFDPETSDTDVFRVERGGEVTYHGPGQWVGYPILDLRRHRRDLHWYLRELEAVLIDVCAQLGLTADRVPGLTGVWIEGRKVAAMGIRATKWISWHGFALNVRTDLSAFDRIVPCGIDDRPVGSLHQFLPEISMAAVQPLIVRAMGDRFQLVPRCIDLQEWLAGDAKCPTTAPNSARSTSDATR